MCEIQGAWNRQHDEPRWDPDRVSVYSGASTVYGRQAGSLGSLQSTLSGSRRKPQGSPRRQRRLQGIPETRTSIPDGLLQKKPPDFIAPQSLPQKSTPFHEAREKRRKKATKVAKRAHTAILQECSPSQRDESIGAPTSRSPYPLPASSLPEARAVTAGMAQR